MTVKTYSHKRKSHADKYCKFIRNMIPDLLGRMSIEEIKEAKEESLIKVHTEAAA